MVCTSDCQAEGPRFDSLLYPRNCSGSIGSGTGSTQPLEDNWVLLDMRSREIRLKKLKLRLRDKRFANHKAPWQQPLQSVLTLRGYSATDLFIYTLLLTLVYAQDQSSLMPVFSSVQMKKLALVYYKTITCTVDKHCLKVVRATC